MKWLSQSTFDVRDREQLKVHDTPDVGSVLFESEEFLLWRERKIRRLRIYGDPGSGKVRPTHYDPRRYSRALDFPCLPYFETLDRSITGSERMRGRITHREFRR